jgi:hypothetical protein
MPTRLLLLLPLLPLILQFHATPAGAAERRIIVRSGVSEGMPGQPGEPVTGITHISTRNRILGLRSEPFTDADFAEARSGVPAVVIEPEPGWIQSLALDPEARWMNAPRRRGVWPMGRPPRSALYAIPFDLGDQAIERATLTIRWVVDDRLGDPDGGANPIGMYLNEVPLSDAFTGGSSRSESVASQDVTGLVRAGENTLYVYQRDVSGVASGILFSAVLEVDVQSPVSVLATSWGRVKALHF